MFTVSVNEVGQPVISISAGTTIIMEVQDMKAMLTSRHVIADKKGRRKVIAIECAMPADKE